MVKRSPSEVKSAKTRAEFEHDTEIFEGYFKFPAPTRLVLESGAQVVFTGPVVFAVT